MNNDFRSRVLMPIVLPIVVLLAIFAFVGLVALTLLYNTHYGALALAAVVAGGILFTASLASSRDRLDTPRRGIVVFAAALPLLVGGAIAAGLIGGVADEERMINVEPLVSIPEDAPVIAAENATEFCLPDGEGGCEPIDSWEVTPSELEELLSFVFENRDEGVPHNVQITDVGGSVEEPDIGDEQFVASEVISGVSQEYYVDEQLSWEELPEQWYFYCVVHPVMNGVGTLAGGDA